MRATKRIQLSRKKGARIPKGAVIVARPSRWGNRYRVISERDAARGMLWCVVAPWAIDADLCQRVSRYYRTKAEASARAVELFRAWLQWKSLSASAKYLAPLRKAKALACWCPFDKPCHADVLIEALR